MGFIQNSLKSISSSYYSISSPPFASPYCHQQKSWAKMQRRLLKLTLTSGHFELVFLFFENVENILNMSTCSAIVDCEYCALVANTLYSNLNVFRLERAARTNVLREIGGVTRVFLVIFEKSERVAIIGHSLRPPLDYSLACVDSHR